MEYKSNSYDETVSLARDFAKDLKSGDIICMYGDLGAGKTAFVQGLAEGLGVVGYVNSPTFTIVNIYPADGIKLNHFDAYRIGDCDDMLDIGFDELVSGDDISVIEWAELIEDIIPKQRYNITIQRTGDTSRDITIEFVE